MVNRGVSSGGEAPASLLEALGGAGQVVAIPPGWAILAERTAPEKAYVLLDDRSARPSAGRSPECQRAGTRFQASRLPPSSANSPWLRLNATLTSATTRSICSGSRPRPSNRAR